MYVFVVEGFVWIKFLNIVFYLFELIFVIVIEFYDVSSYED